MHRSTAGLVAALFLASVSAPIETANAAHVPGHGISNSDGNSPDQGGDGETSVSFSTDTVEVSAGFRSELRLVTEPDRSVGTRRPIGCYYFVVVDAPPYVTTFGYTAALSLYEAQGPTPLRPVGIFCFFIDTKEAVSGYPRVWIPNPGPGNEPPLIDLIELEAFARRQITFEPPVLELSPPNDQIVGVATWLAVTSPLDHNPVSAQAGPIWITATPVFEHVTWQMGNGDELVCVDDTDRVWSRERSATAQSSNCTYLFESNGEGAAVETNVTATTTWTIHVLTSDDVASNPDATGQPRGTVSQSATIVANVRELQAVID